MKIKWETTYSLRVFLFQLFDHVLEFGVTREKLLQRPEILEPDIPLDLLSKFLKDIIESILLLILFLVIKGLEELWWCGELGEMGGYIRCSPFALPSCLG